MNFHRKKFLALAGDIFRPECPYPPKLAIATFIPRFLLSFFPPEFLTRVFGCFE
jgi:hypothetical protein